MNIGNIIGKISMGLNIVKFAMWLIPELIKLIQIARDKWPKSGGETVERVAEINQLRTEYVDPRVSVLMRKATGVTPTQDEVAAIREFAHKVEKKLRQPTGKRGHYKIWE